MPRNCLALTLVTVLAATAPAARADDWRREDTTWQAAVTASQVVDCAYTLDLPNHYPTLWETNPLLGRQPNRARIRSTCALAIVGHAAVSRVLPNPWRRYWQVVAIGVETGAIAANISLGLHMTWAW